MNTKEKYDLKQHIGTDEDGRDALSPALQVQIGEPQKHTRVIHTKGTVRITCPRCKSLYFKKDGKIKTSNIQRYRCKDCDKSFSLSSACVDLDELFLYHYDNLHKDELHILNTKNRKMTVNQYTKSYQRFFNGRVKALNFEGRLSDAMIVKQAFKDANFYIDEQEQAKFLKQKDTFAFFMNYKNSDISYFTETAHYSLVRNHNIDFYQKQSLLDPLFFCECGSVDLRRHGYNNNARSRLKCQRCDKIFVIRLKNIVPKAYFHRVFKEVFKLCIEWFSMLEELEEQLVHDFYNTEFYTYFESVVTRVQLFTHKTPHYIMRLFLLMQLMRLLTYLTKQINKRTYYNEREITNVQYIGELKDLSFLKSDEKTISDMISLSERFEKGIPQLFDIELLLERAVEHSVFMAERISRSQIKT